MKDEPLTEIRIGGGGQSGEQRSSFNKGRQIQQKLLQNSLLLSPPVFINDLEQGVKHLMRKENKETASPNRMTQADTKLFRPLGLPVR